MEPSIRVRMKKTGDLFSSFKKYIYEKDLFKILDRINSLEETDNKEVYGSIVIDYTESSLAGCRIKSELTLEQYYNLYDSIKLLKENQENAFS